MSTLSRLHALSASMDKPSSSWERAITITPVVLTVIATILAGLSSNEMIQAQYHRSLAAQFQSKVGDQWAFYQAKRIRNTILETSLDSEAGPPHPIDLPQLQSTFTLLQQQFSATHTEADKLLQKVESNKSSLSASADSLRQAIGKLRNSAQAGVSRTGSALGQLRDMHQHQDVAAALAYLGSDRLPPSPQHHWNDAEIREAIQGIHDRRSDADLAPLLLRIDPTHMDEAVRVDEENVRAAEEAGKRVGDALQKLDDLVKQEWISVRELHRSLAGVQAAMPTGDRAVSSGINLEDLTHQDQRLQHIAEELADYRTARTDYTARREQREARENQKLASLYELQVHKAAVTSERHRRRSRNFFYGMLCAQAGVAIASFSLAARHKSGLWTLAGVIGLTAVAFSVYVYLYI